MSSKSAYPPIVCSQGPPPPNPLVVERFQSVVSQLFQQRIVRMGGPVDDDMANLIVAQLLFLDSVDQERDLTMYVNSPGGSVTAGEPAWPPWAGKALAFSGREMSRPEGGQRLSG